MPCTDKQSLIARHVCGIDVLAFLDWQSSPPCSLRAVLCTPRGPQNYSSLPLHDADICQRSIAPPSRKGIKV